MATAPAYAATPNVGSGLVPATADTSRTGPTNTTTVFTGGASGSRVEEITLVGVGTTVLGVVCLFRYDGATYHLIDEFVVTVATPSTTVAAFRTSRQYANLLLKNGDTLRVTTQIAGNQSDRKSTRLNSSHIQKSRMPSSA